MISGYPSLYIADPTRPFSVLGQLTLRPHTSSGQNDDVRCSPGRQSNVNHQVKIYGSFYPLINGSSFVVRNRCERRVTVCWVFSRVADNIYQWSQRVFLCPPDITVTTPPHVSSHPSVWCSAPLWPLIWKFLLLCPHLHALLTALVYSSVGKPSRGERGDQGNTGGHTS